MFAHLASLHIVLDNTMWHTQFLLCVVLLVSASSQCDSIQTTMLKVWWCNDKDHKGTTGNTTLSCNLRRIACQYPEPKTSQYSITLNTQYTEPKTQYQISSKAWCIHWILYNAQYPMRQVWDTLRDHTQQPHQAQTKINLKLYSFGSLVSNFMIHYHNSGPIVLVTNWLYVQNLTSVDLVIRKLNTDLT